jgi:hypothetical protein
MEPTRTKKGKEKEETEWNGMVWNGKRWKKRWIK